MNYDRDRLENHRVWPSCVSFPRSKMVFTARERALDQSFPLRFYVPSRADSVISVMLEYSLRQVGLTTPDPSQANTVSKRHRTSGNLNER